MRAVRSICNLLVGATSLVGACTVPPASQQPANPAAATAQNKNANVAIRGAISGEKQKIQFIYFINPDGHWQWAGGGLVKTGPTRWDRHSETWVFMRELQPDVVVVISTVWDVLDRQLVAGGPTLSPTDPDLEAAMKYSLAAFTDSLLALGVPRVVWLREPVPLPTPTASIDQQSDPARHAVLHRVIDQLAEGRPAVRVLDLAGWVEKNGLAADESARPDKVHWTTDAATRIATEFLGPAVVREALT